MGKRETAWLKGRVGPFIEFIVERLDVKSISEEDFGEFLSKLAKWIFDPLLEIEELQFYREAVLYEYSQKECGYELIPISRADQIERLCRLVFKGTLSYKGFDAEIFGFLYRDEKGKLILEAFWVEIVKRAPSDATVKDSEDVEKFLKEFFVSLLITLIIELLKKLGLFS